MALIRYNTNGNQAKNGEREVLNPFDDLVERWLGFRPNLPFEGCFVPAMDVAQDDKGMLLTVDLPGVDKDAVEIKVNENVLTISGNKKTERDEKTTQYTRKETWEGSFERSVLLPSWADASTVSAELKNGVLAVRVGRKPEAEPKKVEIKVA
jgi:HSP20 family protein